MSQREFPTKASDLKKRIESLIEREYIERDRDDAQKYNYLGLEMNARATRAKECVYTV